MHEPFSATVGGTRWRVAAETWIHERLDELGVTLDGDITQPRIRAWSTQLVVPTDRGIAWFKANCPGLAHEIAVHTELARLLPDDVDTPLAVDRDRGWMITRDRGVTLAERHEPTIQDWQAVVRLAARSQLDLGNQRERLLELGLPDCSPQTVPARMDEMIDRLSGLPARHPAALDTDEAEVLRSARSRVARAAERLASTPVPASLQHGDLHPGNVFVVDGDLRIFDFGDAQWAHPLEVLCVPYGVLTTTTDLPWRPVFEAYAREWSDVASVAEVESWLADAVLTQPVNRALTWWDALADASDDELAEWGDAPAHHLEHVLEPWP